MGVDLRLIDHIIGSERAKANGHKIYSLWDAYPHANLVTYPSTYEGFGLPPLEAMACGVPVACSSIPSLVEVAGDAALFFNPKDPASITAALERILHDERLRVDLKDKGFHRSAELSWNVAAQKTRFLYRRAANL